MEAKIEATERLRREGRWAAASDSGSFPVLHESRPTLRLFAALLFRHYGGV